MTSARSIVASLAGIIVAGGIGAVSGWWIVRMLAVDGVPGALLTIFVAMVIALGAFALGVHISNRFSGRS